MIFVLTMLLFLSCLLPGSIFFVSSDYCPCARPGFLQSYNNFDLCVGLNFSFVWYCASISFYMFLTVLCENLSGFINLGFVVPILERNLGVRAITVPPVYSHVLRLLFLSSPLFGIILLVNSFSSCCFVVH